MSRSHVTICWAFLFCTLGDVLPLAAQDDEGEPKSNAADLQAVQGLWERSLRDREGNVVGRATKHVQKNNETVTYYDSDANVLQAHRVEIVLRREGGVRHFMHSPIQIIAGPNKGARSQQGGGYIYKIEGDRFLEIQGILIGQ
ncbi:MAG: hypothetical protein CMJ64_20290 [Planctomycetaceae bacterium]|jgi:hypothetical protein|nr:hypothetical protein [Planctomycetaceae bacterium]